MDSSPARFTNPAYGRLGKPHQQVKKYQNFYHFYHFIPKQKLFGSSMLLSYMLKFFYLMVCMSEYFFVFSHLFATPRGMNVSGV
jgi:hypothetical protein